LWTGYIWHRIGTNSRLLWIQYEHMSYNKDREFLGQLNNYQLLKGFMPWTWLIIYHTWISWWGVQWQKNRKHRIMSTLTCPSNQIWPLLHTAPFPMYHLVPVKIRHKNTYINKLIIKNDLCLGLCRGLFPWGFLTKISYAFFILPCMLQYWRTDLFLFDWIAITVKFGEEFNYTIRKLTFGSPSKTASPTKSVK
jgi:hypothetical protein